MAESVIDDLHREYLTASLKSLLHSPPAPTKSEQKHSEGHILVLEDDEIQRMYVNKLLTAMNFQISEAASGHQALHFLRRCRDLGRDMPHVILADVSLPDGSLYDFMPEINTLVPGRVIAVSVSEDVEDYDRCMAAHCTDYIMKPPRASELKLKISSLIKKQLKTAAQNSSSAQSSTVSSISFTTDVHTITSGRSSAADDPWPDEAHGADHGLPSFCEPSMCPNYARIYTPEPPPAPPITRHRKSRQTQIGMLDDVHGDQILP